MFASFIWTFFFNFDVFSTFILNILTIKGSFCYLDEQILIAGVSKISNMVFLCFLGILRCKQGLNIRWKKEWKKTFKKCIKKKTGIFSLYFLLRISFTHCFSLDTAQHQIFFLSCYIPWKWMSYLENEVDHKYKYVS